MVRITDKEFVYTPSYDTDLLKNFRAIIERQRKANQQSEDCVPGEFVGRTDQFQAAKSRHGNPIQQASTQ